MVKVYALLVSSLLAAHPHDTHHEIQGLLQVEKFSIGNRLGSQTTSATQALQMEEKFEMLAAEAVRTGQTPSLGAAARLAVDTALDTLEGELAAEKSANDDVIVSANAAVTQCNTARNTDFTKAGGVDAFQSTMTGARSTHSACRSAEDTDRGDEKTKKDAMDSTAQTGHNGRPNCPCDVAFSPSSMNSCLQSAGDWFNLYKTDLGNKIAAYNTSVTKASEKATTCDANQGAFEMAFCEYEVLLSATCSTQSACITLQTSNRGTAKTNMQAKVASEKLMWKSCKKVRCYLDMLNATKVNQSGFDTCKSLVTDTSSLDITYPDAPTAVACDVSPVATKPGDDAWKVTEYNSLAPSQTWLSGFEGIESVTACSEPAPAAGSTQLMKFIGEGWCGTGSLTQGNFNYAQMKAPPTEELKSLDSCKNHCLAVPDCIGINSLITSLAPCVLHLEKDTNATTDMMPGGTDAWLGLVFQSNGGQSGPITHVRPGTNAADSGKCFAKMKVVVEPAPAITATTTTTTATTTTSPYARSAVGSAECPIGYQVIMDEATCKNFVDTMEMKYVSTSAWPNIPSGCWSNAGDQQTLYFNTHSNGQVNSQVERLCKKVTTPP